MDFSDCLNKHFADRFAAQKLLRTLDTARVEGVLSTVSAQLMTRQVVTALEQYDATPGVYRKDLGTQCDYLQAALRRGQPSVGQQGGNEGDKARALARKTDTAFRAGRLPDLTAIADYIVSHAPTVDDVAVARSTRGGGGGNGTGGGHADGHTGGGQVRGSDRGPDKGKGRPSHGDRNGNGKRPQADGGASMAMAHTAMLAARTATMVAGVATKVAEAATATPSSLTRRARHGCCTAACAGSVSRWATTAGSAPTPASRRWVMRTRRLPWRGANSAAGRASG